MMWNTINNDECLRLWKELRDSIQNLSLDDKLKEVANFTSSMPFGHRTIDYYSPWDWPTPWEILYHSMFCTSSISLLIYHTLSLVDKSVIELYLVEDDDVYLLPVINNTYVLNYELGKVILLSEISQDIKILKIYTSKDIHEVI